MQVSASHISPYSTARIYISLAFDIRSIPDTPAVVVSVTREAISPDPTPTRDPPSRSPQGRYRFSLIQHMSAGNREGKTLKLTSTRGMGDWVGGGMC